jgi:predicted MFS family arabinose efflux permease
MWKFLKNTFWEEEPVLRLYLLFFALSGILTSTFFVYAPVYLPKLGYEELKIVGILIGIPNLMSLLSQNLWGYLCLKKDRFRLFLFLTLLSFFVLFSALYSGIVELILPALFFYGFFVCALFPTAQTLVTLLCPERKGEAIGKLFAMESVGWGISSWLGGEMLNYFGDSAYSMLFFGSAVLAVLGMFLLLTFFPSRVKGLDWTHMGLPDRHGYVRVLGNKKLLSLLFFVLLVATGSGFLFFYFGRYLVDILSGTERQMGICMALATLGGAVAFPLAGRLCDRKGAVWTLLLCWFLYIVDFGLITLITDSWWFVIVYAAPLYPFLAVAANSLIANDTMEKDRGIGFGLLDTCFQLGNVIAPLLGAVCFGYLSLEYLPYIGLLVIAPVIMLLPFIAKKPQTQAGS